MIADEFVALFSFYYEAGVVEVVGAVAAWTLHPMTVVSPLEGLVDVVVEAVGALAVEGVELTVIESAATQDESVGGTEHVGDTVLFVGGKLIVFGLAVRHLEIDVAYVILNV